jgi:hypothetical protein
MRLPAIDPEARRVLDGMHRVDNIAVVSDLADIEQFAADPRFDPEDFGIRVPDRQDIFVTRTGHNGQWWVYWRLMPRDPRPLRWLHVLHIEPAPPVPVL